MHIRSPFKTPMGQMQTWKRAEKCREISGCFFEAGYLIGLRAFGALYDVELYFVTLFETLVSFALDRTVMNEDIGALIATEEAIPFCVVEPLYCSFVVCQD